MDESNVKQLLRATHGEFKVSLENLRKIMASFGDPQDDLPTIHIAGTNGKGSTAKMMATILQQAGYKVGLYTSPHLVRYNERIQINGEEITDADIEALSEKIQEAIDHLDAPIGFFGRLTALAWLYFSKKKVDIVVLEVGLGGRLDATNIISRPLLTMITQISYDHQQILGNTLKEIAYEKAGILKEGVPSTLYPQALEADEVIRQRANELKVPIHDVKKGGMTSIMRMGKLQTFTYQNKPYALQLMEGFQVWNAAHVIEGIKILREEGYDISDKEVQIGLRDTIWPMRYDKIEENPDVIMDGSHNMEGIHQLKKDLLTDYPNSPRIAIIGMLEDKDYRSALKDILPLFNAVITVTPDSDRALSAEKMKEVILQLSPLTEQEVNVSKDYLEAYHQAKREAKKEKASVIVAFGSFYYVGVMAEEIKKEKETFD